MLTRLLARELRQRGAAVMTLDEPDAVAQALAANHFTADVYLGFESHPDSPTVVHFYRVPTFESLGGRTLAEALAAGLQAIPGLDPRVEGMRLPVLRETRMPAVLVSVGAVRQTVDAAPLVVDQVLHAIDEWVDITQVRAYPGALVDAVGRFLAAG